MPTINPKGVAIHYEEFGTGEPLILIHGSGATWRMFEPQLEAFSKQYRLIIPDMRGHGGSGPLPRIDLYHSLMAEDTLNLMDALGIPQAHILGVSMGAVVALRFGVMYPDRAKSLVITNGYSELPGLQWGPLLKLYAWLFRLIPQKSLEKLFMNVYDPKKEGHALVREVLAKSFCWDKELLDKLKNVRFPSFTAELARVTAPMLILAGDGLRGMEVRGAKAMFAATPKATMAIFKDAFDPLNLMRVEIFTDMVLDFLGGQPLKAYPGVSVTTR